VAGATDAIRRLARRDGPLHVHVHEGTYYLPEPLRFAPADSGCERAPIVYQAAPGEQVTLSGGKRLECDWRPYRDGIMMCQLEPGLQFDQLFVNGTRQVLARYPNRDTSAPEQYSGHTLPAGELPRDTVDPCPSPHSEMTFSSGPPRGIVFDPDRFTDKQWANPDQAIIHIYQYCYWGNLQWRVKHIDWDAHHIWFGQGGQQMGAKWFDNPCGVSEWSHFYIENVFEELDAPGEWYLDTAAGVLYLMPEEGVCLDDALVECSQLERVVEFRGCQQDPVHHITLSGFRFAHTASTFLAEYEIPSLGDWAIHRGGSVRLEGAWGCTISDCHFDAVGGNGVFMNNHNRQNRVTDCVFSECGDSAICFVGSLEKTVGWQKAFPHECVAHNNRIHRCGAFGKQVAGVYISRAKRITASHNLIYDMPRAGICIGDGTWGGHCIEYNHIHDTCRETGDHGPFNAWGRDRGWCLAQSHAEYTTGRSHDAYDMLIDAMEPVVIRHNFFEEHSGWGLDLDDGASNYEIYNNLCVGVSMKLREGCHRTIYNNIWVNGANSPCFHVGNEDNGDRYFRNITVMSAAHATPENDLNFEMGEGFGEVYTLIAPPSAGAWLAEMDHNCFFSDVGEFIARVEPREAPARKYSLDQWRELGFDAHSVFADPRFVDPANNDYRVQPDSPALAIGFQNFPMHEWGLVERSKSDSPSTRPF
jgi:hypothetical protein